MDLDILMLFLKESKANDCYLTAEGYTKFYNDLNKGVLKFKTNCSKDFFISDNSILLVQYLDGSIIRGYTISYLKERNLLNLPEAIINLLIDNSLAKHKLALNLIKNLYINKK